jgi:hypothetical protein
VKANVIRAAALAVLLLMTTAVDPVLAERKQPVEFVQSEYLSGDPDTPDRAGFIRTPTHAVDNVPSHPNRASGTATLPWFRWTGNFLVRFVLIARHAAWIVG